MKARGYYGVGIYATKDAKNIGTLWRSAHLFGASFVFTIGKRYQMDPSDTMKTERHVPLWHFGTLDQMLDVVPSGCDLIGIEQVDGKSRDLNAFAHPERCIYLLGAEDRGLPDDVIASCKHLVSIDTPRCLNVAVAGSITMFHRNMTRSAQC